MKLRRIPPDGSDSRKELHMKLKNTRTLTGMAIMTAIVIVLQLLGSFIRFGPFSISLVLIPIVVGAALYGEIAGAWLGFIFGLVVLLSGDAGVFLAVNPLGTILTVLVKGAAAGYVAGLLFRLIAKKNETVAVIVAAIAAPIVNTGIFLIGCLLFFMDIITEWAGGTPVGTFMIVGLVGANFLFEVLFNIVLSPVIVRLLSIAKKGKKA